MKTLILIFGSLLASLTGARFPSLRTANATAAPTADDFSALQARLDAQEAELKQLRAAALPAAPKVADATALLIKGAGVEPENVNWRIAAGLSASQAVEVAAREKLEADEAEKAAKKAKK